MRRRSRIALLLGVLVLAAAWWAAAGLSLSTIKEPGRLETWAATRAKRWLVGREARALDVTLPARGQALAIGEMRFRGQCAPCHGQDGRTPTDIGLGMYPRAVDLGSPEVQGWSDPELFVIVRDGIRMTGMPGFGRKLDDGEIASVVAYVRSLGAPSERQERSWRAVGTTHITQGRNAP